MSDRYLQIYIVKERNGRLCFVTMRNNFFALYRKEEQEMIRLYRSPRPQAFIGGH